MGYLVPIDSFVPRVGFEGCSRFNVDGLSPFANDSRLPSVGELL